MYLTALDYDSGNCHKICALTKVVENLKSNSNNQSLLYTTYIYQRVTLLLLHTERRSSQSHAVVLFGILSILTTQRIREVSKILVTQRKPTVTATSVCDITVQSEWNSSENFFQLAQNVTIAERY